ncbi:MAG: LuxR C-terminal-related transcriptional regulator, partial [Thermomicrobiales bacterium]
WSYDLLEPEAQAVFRSLAVFSGGFSLEAAQAVTQAGEYTLDHLSSLLDHSLLVRLEDPAELRFVMLDTIREFAADMLGVAEEMARARDRHARYFLGLIDTDLERPAQNAAWLDLVDSEIGNLRDALVWLESARCAADLRRLCNLLAHWWLTRGSVTEGNEWTRRADTIAGEVPVPVQMLFDLNLAWMATQVGDFALANETMKRIDFPTLETQSMRLRSTYRMARGALSFYEGDLEAAFASIDEARVLAEEAGTATQNPSIRINLGAIARARGDFDESRIQHSLGLQQTSEPGVRAMHTSALAEIELQTGNLQNAWDYLSATWRECRALGHVLIMISAMATKVELLLKLDRPEEATTLMGAADQLRLSRGWSINTYSESEYFGLLDSCRAQLTPEAFDAAMANGRTLSIGQIDSMMEADPFSATASPLTSAKADSRWMLTARELDVLRQLVEGKSNPEIARALFISERTVQTHVARILQKLGVSSRSAAAVAAVRDHIV